MSNVIYCPDCGVKNDSSATFCGNCGSQIKGGAKGASQSTSQPMTTASSPQEPPQQPPQQVPQKYEQQPTQQDSQQPQQGYQQPQQGFRPVHGGPQQGYQQPGYGVQQGYQKPRKDPGIGFLGTFFIPGFAYFYTDRAGEGVVYLLLTFVTYFFLLGIVFHAILFFTSGGVVKDWNRQHGYPE